MPAVVVEQVPATQLVPEAVVVIPQVWFVHVAFAHGLPLVLGQSVAALHR
jgi:hypothetical protein